MTVFQGVMCKILNITPVYAPQFSINNHNVYFNPVLVPGCRQQELLQLYQGEDTEGQSIALELWQFQDCQV